MDDPEGQDKITNRKTTAHKLMSLYTLHTDGGWSMSSIARPGVFNWTFFVLPVHSVHWYRVGRVKGAVPLK